MTPLLQSSFGTPPPRRLHAPLVSVLCFPSENQKADQTRSSFEGVQKLSGGAFSGMFPPSIRFATPIPWPKALPILDLRPWREEQKYYSVCQMSSWHRLEFSAEDL